MFSLCDRIDKEAGKRTYSSPKESPDRVKEEERGRMIGQYPKAEVAPFFVSGNRYKEISFEDRDRHERMVESHAKLRMKKRNRALGQDDRRIQAKLYKIPLVRKRENTLRRNPSKS